MQVPLVSGIYTKGAAFRTSLPRNLVPVPKNTGIAEGYFKPAPGIEPFGPSGADAPGVDRGGAVWNGVHFRVLGDALVKVNENGEITILGFFSSAIGAPPTPTTPTPREIQIIRKSYTPPPATPGSPIGSQTYISKRLDVTRVRFAHGPDRLAVWADGALFYYTEPGVITRVTDTDLSIVKDGVWLGGYFVSTDGVFIIATDITNPLSVNPLKYGTAESDPDDIRSLARLRNEIYALGRHTIEVFENVGGTAFPFQRIQSAQVMKGVLGQFTWAYFLDSIAFVGSSRGEGVGVWVMTPGDAQKVSTAEIDSILSEYSTAVLEAASVESRSWQGQVELLVHLPDQTLIYDHAATQSAQVPIWSVRTSSMRGGGVYRIRNLVLAFNQWIGSDPGARRLGRLSDSVSSHWGEAVGVELQTAVLYSETSSGIVKMIELVSLTGRSKSTLDSTVWTSYSHDGLMWSQEKPIKAGAPGDTLRRLVWRVQGVVRHWRIQRFRWTSDAHISPIRLNVDLEPLRT